MAHFTLQLMVFAYQDLPVLLGGLSPNECAEKSWRRKPSSVASCFVLFNIFPIQQISLVDHEVRFKSLVITAEH